MIANLFIVAELEPSTLRQALAALLVLTDESVDVCDVDGDQEARRWNAPVLCTYRVLPLGDLALELEVQVEVEDGTSGTWDEAALAQGLAARTATSVLYPSPDLELDSAYRVATADGRDVRCRLEAIDSDEDTTYRVEAVEEPVPDLPGATVEPLPEVLDNEPLPTPLSDAFLDPPGRYREDLLKRDLEARDNLDRLSREMGAPHAEALRSTLTRLDRIYRDHTLPGPGQHMERWWWHQRLKRAPWKQVTK
jgi:hypothetical protein